MRKGRRENMSLHPDIIDAIVAAGASAAVVAAACRAAYELQANDDEEAAAEDERRRAARRPAAARRQRKRRERAGGDLFERDDEQRYIDAAIENASHAESRQQETPPIPLKKKESISVKESDSDSKDKYSSSAALCPADWQPSEEHHAAAAAKGLGREKVDQLAAEMRAWSQANKHKDCAFKADWSAAFHGWIARQKTVQKPILTVVQGGRAKSPGEETYMDQYIRENPEAWRECQLRNGIKI
jgi:hypothetical protein